VADYYGVTRAQVFVGNGSDEVLAHVFHGLLKHAQPLLFPDISYSFYPVYANLYQIATQIMPLAADFSLDLSAYPTKNGGIIFPNPNAPTGMALGLAAIEALLQRNTESVVVVDEAYIDFGGETAIPLVAKYPNLLVVQTFSKSRSLAGLRVGFAVGHPDLIAGLERIKNSFNSYPLGRLALAGAAAAMQDRDYFQTTCQQIINTREWTVTQLTQLGFKVLPSTANFVFARPPQGNAESLYQQLKTNGILVRYFNKPRINEYLRITIGTEAEMQAFIDKLAVLLK
jgi:histidinol-phosphate aminotransferase